MAYEIVMPAVDSCQETGLLVRWLKSPGDRVAKGEPLMEVETDKGVVEIEAPASGILGGIRASAGDRAPVGQVIALLLDDGEQTTRT
jgi:pyruvate/2-oxoglutarate dehydrogenase complex dihydrolipoamide acyltransferase (E2) component